MPSLPRCFFDISIDGTPGKSWTKAILLKYRPVFFSRSSDFWTVCWCEPNHVWKLQMSLYRLDFCLAHTPLMYYLLWFLGEKGEGKSTFKPLHYKGTPIHRIVKGFIVQGGDFSEGLVYALWCFVDIDSPIREWDWWRIYLWWNLQRCVRCNWFHSPLHRMGYPLLTLGACAARVTVLGP